MLDNVLAWMTFWAGLVLFLLTAGPMSIRPFIERVFVWLMAVTLIGASLFRIVAIFDPTNAEHAAVVGYVIMLLSRAAIAVTGLIIVCQWAARCKVKCERHTRIPSSSH